MSQRRPLTMKFILSHILPFWLSVQISKRYGVCLPSDVRCVKNYPRHPSPRKWSENSFASCIIFLFLILPYSMLPFVSSSSSSEPFYDDFENGNATENFISHMSRSQLGYSASRAASPTEMSHGQNDFDDGNDFSYHRTSSSPKSER